MANDTDNDIDARLARLPAPALDEQMAARVRARARAVLAAEAARPAWLTPLARAWSTAAPALVAATCVAYLTWAVSTAAALYR